MNVFFLLALLATGLVVLLVAGVILLWRARPAPYIRRLLLVLLAIELLLALAQPGILSTGRTLLNWNLYLGAERRFAVAMAAAQLCMAGVAALLLGLRWTRTDSDFRIPEWGVRLYWLVLGAGFLFLAVDEFFVIHETNRTLWRALYLLAGSAMVLPIGFLLIQGGRHRRIYSLLLVGLATMAASGVLLDMVLDHIVRQGTPCGGPAWLDALCDSFALNKPVWNLLEELAELVGVTLALGALLLLGQTNTAPHRAGDGWRRAWLRTSRVVPLAGALALALYIIPWWVLPGLELRLRAEPVLVEYQGGDLALVGYWLEGNPAQPGEEVKVHLYWQARRPLQPPEFRLSLHVLVPPEHTRSLAQADEYMLGARFPGTAFIPGVIVTKELELTLPADAPAGNHALMLRLWSGEPPWRELTGHDASYSNRRMLSSDMVLFAELEVLAAP